MAEFNAAEFDRATQPADLEHAGSDWHVGLHIQDIKDAVCTGSSPLRRGHEAAHGVELAVESADIENKTRQHTDGGVLIRDAPCASTPDDEQTDVSEQADRWLKEGPSAIHAIIGVKDLLILLAEAVDLTLLLSKGFDDTHTWDRIREHAIHRTPGTTGSRKTAA